MIIFRGQEVRYCLDQRAGQLWRGGHGKERIHLARKEWEVLRYLAERPGDLITKVELLDKIWGSEDTSVGETSVSQAISKIRSAIGDQAKLSTVIETISGRGYRFIAQIESAEDVHVLPPPRTLLDLYATVPPLPPTFFERPEISEPLLEKVIGTRRIVGITAVEGMGGVGKTLVTISLCQNPRVRQLFPDGIVWLDIGKESGIGFEDRVKFIAHAMNSEFRDYTAAEYHSLLENKSVLLILDDVWTLEDVEPFRIGSARSRLLYTSRNKTLAGSLGAENQDVDVLDPEQARRFLNRWAGREKRPPPEPFATGILEQSKGLALGLAMMGAALKGQPDGEWENILADLKKARLKDVGLRPGGYAYQTLHAAIEVSVNALPTEDKGRYLKLAVLLEDMLAHPVLLRQLWGGDERGILRTIRMLTDRSLARRDSGGIRLHDFQLDYVRGEHPHPDALEIQQRALLLSSHVVRKCPEEFASQMIGRLLAYKESPGMAPFLEELKTNATSSLFISLRPALVAAGGQMQLVLEGHSGKINAVAITADGRWAISGSDDKTLRLWDLERNQLLRVLEGHSGKINAVAITADGRWAISGSDDKTLRFWDLKGNQSPRVLKGHSDSVNSAAITADGRWAISGSDDKTLRFWDQEGNQPPRLLKGHSGGINAVAITADGRRAISGSWDNTLRVWDLERSQPPRVLEGHFEGYAKGIDSVAMTLDGRRVITGSRDHTLRVWDLEGNQPPRVLEGPSDSDAEALAITADGRWAISASDGKLRVWDLEGNQPPRLLEGSSELITAVAITADGRRAISGSFDNTVRIWALEEKELPRLRERHSEIITTVAITSDGRRAISGSFDETVLVWDLDSDQPPRVLKDHSAWIRTVAITADGRRAISGSDDYILRVWDLDGNRPSRVLEHQGGINAVAITADGRRAISASWDNTSGSWDNTLRVWDLEGNKSLRVLKGHSGKVNAVAITADGRLAISGSDDNTLRAWDLERGQSLAKFSCDYRVTACTFANKRIVAGDSGGNFHVLAWEE